MKSSFSMQIRFMPAFGGKPPKRKKAIETRKKLQKQQQQQQREHKQKQKKMASKIGCLSCRATNEREKKSTKKDKYVVCTICDSEMKGTH